MNEESMRSLIRTLRSSAMRNTWENMAIAPTKEYKDYFASQYVWLWKRIREGDRP